LRKSCQHLIVAKIDVFLTQKSHILKKTFFVFKPSSKIEIVRIDMHTVKMLNYIKSKKDCISVWVITR